MAAPPAAATCVVVDALAVCEPVVRCDIDWTPFRALEAQCAAMAAQFDGPFADCAPAVRKLLSARGINQHSAEWHNVRRMMLTASNVGSVLGLDKYCSAKQMFKRKTGQLAHNIVPSAATTHGNSTEDEAREQVARVTGLQLVRDAQGRAYDVGLRQHPAYKWLGASPDGIFKGGQLLEIKCPFSRAIRHDCLPGYYAQIQVQLEVCDLDACIYAQFKPTTCFSAGELDILLIKRDREWFADTMARHFLPFWSSVEAYYAVQGHVAQTTLVDLATAPTPPPAPVLQSPSPHDASPAVKRARTEQPLIHYAFRNWGIGDSSHDTKHNQVKEFINTLPEGAVVWLTKGIPGACCGGYDYEFDVRADVDDAFRAVLCSLFGERVKPKQ